MSKILTTPASQFENLPDYPFNPNYQTVGDQLQMHYVDEGKGDIVLMLHGEPSWSFLYRKMIPVFVNNGYRAIAPDLIGFGKSDKLSETSDYSYAKHIQWVLDLIVALDLKNITLFCQDWGGLVGLRIAIDHQDRFSRIVVANTGLPTGSIAMPEAFMKWRQFSQTVPQFPTSTIINNATTSTLSPEVIAAYDAPYPDESYKAGARIFPALVPIDTEDPEAKANVLAWKKFSQWTKPLLTLFSDKDPITKNGEKPFQKIVPGAKGQKHTIIEGGGHFLQEDKGEEIANLVVDFIKTN